MGKRFLVVVLDWGLGHATRCIPIIQLLLARRCHVTIGGSAESLMLLRHEFPEIDWMELPPYKPAYPRNASMVGKMIAQLPRFARVIGAEHRVIERWCSEHQTDVVISDNRYGCWSSQCHTILITHQSNVLMPKRFGFLQNMVRIVNKRLAGRFNECWIPDHPGAASLAGRLIEFGDDQYHSNMKFIGPLSRFNKMQRENESTYDIVAVCSGPEPQRSLLEKLLRRELEKCEQSYLLVRGILEEAEPVASGRGMIINYMTSDLLNRVLNQAKLIIARSGYSTVMDLNVLGKKAVFIPTPGQTEQEYLARSLRDKGIAFYMDQHTFDLDIALRESAKYRGFDGVAGNERISDIIDQLIATVQ